MPASASIIFRRSVRSPWGPGRDQQEMVVPDPARRTAHATLCPVPYLHKSCQKVEADDEGAANDRSQQRYGTENQRLRERRAGRLCGDAFVTYCCCIATAWRPPHLLLVAELDGPQPRAQVEAPARRRCLRCLLPDGVELACATLCCQLILEPLQPLLPLRHQGFHTGVCFLQRAESGLTAHTHWVAACPSAAPRVGRTARSAATAACTALLSAVGACPCAAASARSTSRREGATEGPRRASCGGRARRQVGARVRPGGWADSIGHAAFLT